MRLGIITDEISPRLDRALRVCEDLDVSTVELRVVDGTNIVSHDDASIKSIKKRLDAGGFEVCSVASPFLKVHLGGDGAPEGDTHAAAPATREEQWDVLRRSFEIAHLLGAPMVRAFSFWRLPDPTDAREELLETLTEAARRAGEAGLKLVLENEHECNLGTGEEAAWALERIPSEDFGLIWDPGNEAKLGSTPFPDGYARVRDRIAHVHLKDVDREGRWTRICKGTIAYAAQLRALADDGYDGVLSLETHYETPGGGKEGATRESAAAVRELCARVGVDLEA